MKIFEYEGYEDYVRAQVEANLAKLDVVWVTPQSVAAVCEHRGQGVRRVLCHGTRNAAEQLLFRSHYPSAEIIGTEISPTAVQFPMTCQWDMMWPNLDWFGMFDVVYSNAIDHALYPGQTVRTWLGQLAESGVLYIDHANGERCNRSTRMDPLEISDEEMEALIVRCGGRVEHKMNGLGPRGFVTLIYAIRRAVA
jgi:hypothetical protein